MPGSSECYFTVRKVGEGGSHSYTVLYGVYSTFRKKGKERMRNDDGEGKGSRKYRRKRLRKGCFGAWQFVVCTVVLRDRKGVGGGGGSNKKKGISKGY